jgi:O-antigen/teichoic acid export membrane protein
MQGQHRHGEFNVLRLAPAMLYASVALSLFVLDAGTLPLIAACTAACWLAIGVLTLVLAVRRSPPPPPGVSPPPTAQLVRFGTRAMLGSVSPSDGAGIDQVVIGLFLSTRALGLYVVAAAFMNLSRLVTQSIGLVAYPNVAGRRDPQAAARAMWRFTAIGVAAAIAIIAALELVVDHLIVFFFGESFAPAAGVARILLLAALFLGVRRVLSDAARGANRPLAGTVAEVVSWAVLIPAMIVLTPLFGLHGVAWALVLASVASLCVIVWRVRRPLPPQSPQPASGPVAPNDVVIDVRDVT